jgi:hypothetical protein
MDRKELENKIRAFLAQDSPEYFEGVQLYANHPEAKKTLVLNFNQRFNKGSMHEKLVYELEKLVGAAVYSNRRTVLNHNPANIPYQLVSKTKVDAPENYEYKVKFEKLPDQLKKLVIEKGQLYIYLEKLKHEMSKIGTQNDETSIDGRQLIYEKMQTVSQKIKEIHAYLLEFEEKGLVITEPVIDESVEDELVNERRLLSGAEVTRSLLINEMPELIDIELENEFAYLQMSYYQLKDLLIKLRSAVPKQEQRGKESKKPDVKKTNEEKARLGRLMIALLVKYFEENKEA